MATKERVVEYLKSRGGWVSGTELERMSEEWGTKASVISRRARELAFEGRIEREINSRRAVQYRVGTMWSAERANRFLKSLAMEQGELL